MNYICEQQTNDINLTVSFGIPNAAINKLPQQLHSRCVDRWHKQRQLLGALNRDPLEHTESGIIPNIWTIFLNCLRLIS